MVQDLNYIIFFFFVIDTSYIHTYFVQENSAEAAIGHLQNLRLTVKGFVLAACFSALTECGFTMDDSEFRITKASRISKSHSGGNGIGTAEYTMPFVKQRSKLKCCQRICRFIMYVDFQLQSHLHKIARNQIVRFEADVRRHYKYVPGELHQMNGRIDDVDTLLEKDRSLDDPKVNLIIHPIETIVIWLQYPTLNCRFRCINYYIINFQSLSHRCSCWRRF